MAAAGRKTVTERRAQPNGRYDLIGTASIAKPMSQIHPVPSATLNATAQK